ncbi:MULTISPECIES: CYTH and CHAD domain-containing protein [Psychrobacter]|jgi:inorganic triphosphatase YgiF|uniref:CYTH and CHAD domain-containing protein n=1 Tax=Psychrobacter TaxID=497 RepID=UPI000EE53687|nr:MULTISPECIES: CYTH and CHAD domain-containing protein [Psychrobacter]HCR87204.1 inorganic triphosphatase [Psychrobacter sp.]
MQEIELKFLVPESRLKGLMRQANIKSSQLTQLAAHYYDTPDQQLAKAGIGLRIRQEGDAWVQTIKAGGDGIAARLEHNAVLDNKQVQAMLDTNTFMPDLNIYQDSPIASALEPFKLTKLAKTLTRLYVTDVKRITRLLTDNSDKDSSNQIEMAYDCGAIIHGNDDTQRDSIQEIEFELISGDVDFLFTTAKNWCQRHKLCLSTVTKAERGGLLITGQQHSRAVSANLSDLTDDKDSSRPAFIRAVVHNCLLQILPNSSAIVAGSTDNEHVLQLHNGIQRLLTALKLFKGFSDELNPDWAIILKQTATLLADYRKFAYLASHIEPYLQAHEAPSVDWSAEIEAAKITPIDAVRANDLQLTLLELIAFTMSDPNLEPQADKRAAHKLRKILDKRDKKLLKAERKLDEAMNAKADSTDLDSASLEGVNLKGVNLESREPQSLQAQDIDLPAKDEKQAQYKLYRQLEKMRYVSEFAAPLIDNENLKNKKLSTKKSEKKSKRFLKRLVKAQQALRQQLDTNYYQQCYQYKASTDSDALYGAGWLNASLIDAQKKTKKRLAKLKSADKFW